MYDKTILVVDESPQVRDMLRVALEMADVTVFDTDNIVDGYKLALEYQPDLVLLECKKNNLKKVDFIQNLKFGISDHQVTIVQLVDESEKETKIPGTEGLIEAQIVKPFESKYLALKLKNLLRKSENIANNQPLCVEGLKVDPSSRRVTINDKDVSLSPTEYKLLSFFISNREKVYSREDLLKNVWGGSAFVEGRTVDVHIRRLRVALSMDRHDRLVQTVRGAGYRFSNRI